MEVPLRGDGASTRVISTSADGQVNKLEFTGLDGLLYYELNLGNSVATKHLYLGRTRLVDVEGSSVTYYHSDPTGSPLAATAADGALLWRTSYRPFGEKLAGATTKNQQWFTGKPFEDKIGLSYFGARWYDPVLGRFMAIDPVDWVDSNPVHSFNRYGYGNNNPLRFVDPDGRYSAEQALGPHTSMLGVNPGEQCVGCHGFMIKEEAARDAISVVNPLSILENREYGAYLYQWGAIF